MQVVKDPYSSNKVIYSPGRQNRPEETKGEKIRCPFCAGNEDLLEKIFLELPNKKNWQVRVVKNKYPILKIHEVIIHTPDHNETFLDLTFENARLVFEAYIKRFNHYREKGDVLIYSNVGEEAGASLKHSHSQLVVFNGEVRIGAEFPKPQPIANVVEENDFFWIYCPDYSVWPYELWIRSKKEKFFGDVEEDELISLVFLIRKYLKRLHHLHSKTHKLKIPFSYNWYIYPKKPWYFRLIPRFVYHAGLELASNVVSNIVTPLEASLAYKGVEKDYARVLEKLEKLSK